MRNFTLGDMARRLDEPVYRLEYLLANGYLEPSICAATGKGTIRRFDDRDFVLIRLALELRRRGVAGERLRRPPVRHR